MMTFAHDVCRLGDRSFILALQNTHNVGDEVWDRYIAQAAEEMRARNGPVVGFSVSLGGGPTPHQRAKLHDLTKRTKSSGIVLTDHTITRGIVTALSWLGSDIRAFALRDHLKAMATAGVTGADAMLAALRTLALQVPGYEHFDAVMHITRAA